MKNVLSLTLEKNTKMFTFSSLYFSIFVFNFDILCFLSTESLFDFCH